MTNINLKPFLCTEIKIPFSFYAAVLYSTFSVLLELPKLIKGVQKRTFSSVEITLQKKALECYFYPF